MYSYQEDMRKDSYIMIYLRNDGIDSISYYINNNQTMILVYDRENNELVRINKSHFSTSEISVIKKTKTNLIEGEVDLLTIVSNENNFIQPVEVISSTVKDKGYFQEKNRYGIVSHYFNEFLNSETFMNSKKNNKYKGQDTIELLKKHTPTIYTLLKNLFYQERDEIIVNFINWLNVVSFKDKHQDTVYLFYGTNEINQGQGAGKGVFRTLLEKMYSNLVVSVSNSNYLDRFNSNLINKKIIIYDEVDIKRLNYEGLKDKTGNHKIRIEYKGKEPHEVLNVGSWICFTNEWELFNKITNQDRRTVLVRTNPKNGSLLEIVDEMFNSDFDYFEELLYSEINEFIHIISSVDGKVLSPLKLKTQTHINYFKEQKKVSVLDISSLYKTFVNYEFKEKLFDILDTIKEFDSSNGKIIEDCKNIIKLNTINYKTFEYIFELLQKYNYISTSKKLLPEWNILKDHLKHFGFAKHTIDSKETNTFNRFKDTTVLLNETVKSDKTNIMKINRKIKEVYGVRKS